MSAMVKREILKTLRRTKGVLLPEDTLLDEVQMGAPKSSATEIRSAIEELERERAITSGKMLLSDAKGYRITAYGESLLAE